MVFVGTHRHAVDLARPDLDYPLPFLPILEPTCIRVSPPSNLSTSPRKAIATRATAMPRRFGSRPPREARHRYVRGTHR
eukprot:scaffold883_cov325-Pavlova_lutheri.AAC.15